MNLIKTKSNQIKPTNQKQSQKNKQPKPDEKHSNKREDEDGWCRMPHFAAEYLCVEQDSSLTLAPLKTAFSLFGWAI